MRRFSPCIALHGGVSVRFTGCTGRLAGGNLRGNSKTGPFMDDTVQKSCWGVTAWAVAAFASVILLAWLFGGTETVSVVAAN